MIFSWSLNCKNLTQLHSQFHSLISPSAPIPHLLSTSRTPLQSVSASLLSKHPLSYRHTSWKAASFPTENPTPSPPMWPSTKTVRNWFRSAKIQAQKCQELPGKCSEVSFKEPFDRRIPRFIWSTLHWWDLFTYWPVHQNTLWPKRLILERVQVWYRWKGLVECFSYS